jgi:ketosteroid isomerase-like protein
MSVLPGAHPLAGAARTWLTALERCVRAVDYEGARPLFAPDVIAFGTYARLVAGRDALEREQWRVVWPAIREFAFRLEEAQCVGDETMLGVIVPWDSLGVKSDGVTFSRPGRATLVLVRREGRWAAIHSHFSLAPDAR